MDISVRDLKTMYQRSLILWKNQPCYVSDITEDYKFTLFDLGTQKYKRVKWIPENFVPPSVRIGYVNLGTNCVYMHRIPARRYKIGLNEENIELVQQEHELSRAEKEMANHILGRMDSINLYNSLMGNYPGIENALEEAVENNGYVAFDKQFAIGPNKDIYYKGKRVGEFREGGVQFYSGYSHLSKALTIG